MKLRREWRDAETLVLTVRRRDGAKVYENRAAFSLTQFQRWVNRPRDIQAWSIRRLRREILRGIAPRTPAPKAQP